MGGVDERDSDSNVFVDLVVGNVLDDGHEGVVDDASHEPNGILHRPVAIDGNYSCTRNNDGCVKVIVKYFKDLIKLI